MHGLQHHSGRRTWERVNGPLCFMEKDSGFTRILKYTQPVIVVSTLPGVYQIVLNAALFVLLFWKKKLYFGNEKQYRTATVIVLLTLITCQSTTGYLSMMVILLCFFFMRVGERDIRMLKQKIAVLRN